MKGFLYLNVGGSVKEESNKNQGECVPPCTPHLIIVVFEI